MEEARSARCPKEQIQRAEGVARLTTVPRILMTIQEEVMIQVVVMVVALSSPPLMLLTRRRLA